MLYYFVPTADDKQIPAKQYNQSLIIQASKKLYS